MIENCVFAYRGGGQRRMATFACDNHAVGAIPNQPCNAEARPRPENGHRSTRYRTPTTEECTSCSIRYGKDSAVASKSLMIRTVWNSYRFRTSRPSIV